MLIYNFPNKNFESVSLDDNGSQYINFTLRSQSISYAFSSLSHEFGFTEENPDKRETATQPIPPSFIELNSFQDQKMEVSKLRKLPGCSKKGSEVSKSAKSVYLPESYAKETRVLSKLKKSFRMLKKAQVQLFWPLGMPILTPLFSCKATPVASNTGVTTTGGSSISAIASKRPDALEKLIKGASAYTPTRQLSLEIADDKSNSIVTPATDPIQNGVSRCARKETQTRFFSFTEPLPPDDYRSLVSIALTPPCLSLELKTPSVGKKINCSLLLDSTSINHQTVKKKARFVPDLKDNEYKQANCSTVIEFPSGSEELKTLIIDLRAFADVIVHLEPKALSTIAWSLPHPIDEVLSNLGIELRSCSSDYPYPPHVDPDTEFKDFLRYLDDKIKQRYLCRSCNKLQPPDLRYKNHFWPTSPSASECAAQYIIDNDARHGRLFNKPFRFSELQMAMKFYKQSLNFHRFLRCFNFSITLHDCNDNGVRCLETSNKSKPFSHYIHHIWTSETYIVSDRLFSRIQHFYHTSPNSLTTPSSVELRAFCETRRNHGGVTNLCRHLMDRCQNSTKRGFTLWDFEDQANNPTVRRCQDCALEYRYDWYDVGELGSGLVLTVWRDFGRCLTPFDPRFMAHFEGFEEREFEKRFKGQSEAYGDGRWKEDVESAATEWGVGDIQKEFETGEGFDLEEAVARVEGRFQNLLTIKD